MVIPIINFLDEEFKVFKASYAKYNYLIKYVFAMFKLTFASVATVSSKGISGYLKCNEKPKYSYHTETNSVH